EYHGGCGGRSGVSPSQRPGPASAGTTVPNRCGRLPAPAVNRQPAFAVNYPGDALGVGDRHGPARAAAGWCMSLSCGAGLHPWASDSAESQRLLREARAGEPEARNQLLDRQRPYLHRLVEVRLDSRIRARVDASDVVQEAQLEALRRLDHYLKNPAMPFRLWLRQ